jgi:hypothetical protein
MNILKTYCFLKVSLSLHAIEQLVQETMKCFSPSREESFHYYHCPSNEHGNLSFFDSNIDAPSDY